MQNDSVSKTIIVAAVLCVACSVLVSGSAVSLRPLQEKNKALDIKKNLLLASGLLKNSSASEGEILEAYKKVQAEVIDLETGQIAENIKAESFDQKKARKNPEMNKDIKKENDLAGIKMRSKYSVAYKVVEGGELKMVVLPVNGKGLWSTLYGFVALAPDMNTIKGIGFYQHGETPGLGGEIDNPNWKAQWEGKKVYGDEGRPKIEVLKGAVNPNDSAVEYKVDGLSGATITSNGVTGLVRYWLGQDGFGPYIERLKKNVN